MARISAIAAWCLLFSCPALAIAGQMEQNSAVLGPGISVQGAPADLTITVRHRQVGPDVALRLSSLTHRVMMARVSERSDRLVVFGDTDNSSYAMQVSLFDLGTQQSLGSFLAAVPSISPAGNFVAFVRFVPLSVASRRAEYAVLDVDATAALSSDASVGTLIYPRADGDHSLVSDLTWVDQRTVVFLDRSGDDVRVIAAQLSAAGVPERLAGKVLPADQLVRPLENGKARALLLGQPDISAVTTGKSLTVRLRYPWEPSRKVSRLDVVMW